MAPATNSRRRSPGRSTRSARPDARGRGEWINSPRHLRRHARRSGYHVLRFMRGGRMRKSDLREAFVDLVDQAKASG
jgi:hypothetical protein